MAEKLNQQEIQELRKRFQGIQESIDSGDYSQGGHMYHPVLRRRLGLMFFGDILPQYDALSQEDKDTIGVDMKGLTSKIGEILR